MFTKLRKHICILVAFALVEEFSAICFPFLLLSLEMRHNIIILILPPILVRNLYVRDCAMSFRGLIDALISSAPIMHSYGA